MNAGNSCEGLFFALTADIDLGGESAPWVPIAARNPQEFKGAFDGGGHTVSGLYINSTAHECAGLFGRIGATAVVKDLGVSGYIAAGSNAEAGGIVGFNDHGRIAGCRSACEIAAGDRSGGIVGKNQGTVSGCYNVGSVSATTRAGGIVGHNGENGAVSGCYNVGSVSGGSHAGGIAGNNVNKIENCYNVGAVTGEGRRGSIAGTNEQRAAVTGCYYPANTALGGVGSDDSGTADVKASSEAEFRALAAALGADWVDDPFLGRPVLKDNREPSPVKGDGSPEAPFEIANKEELEKFRDYVNAGHDCTDMYFTLTDDVDLAGGADHPWTPIGWSEGDDKHFNGTFDGGTFTVKGLYVANTRYFSGLFGHIGENGAVKDLVVEGEVNGVMNTGGIAGECDGRMEKCVNTATVTGSTLAGGIVGKAGGSASIQDCVNTGEVTGNSTNIGGIVGQISGDVTISGCQNNGEISGEIANVGGIAGGGQNIPTAATVKNCRNTGKVTGTGRGTNIGGIVGTNDANCTVEDCSNYGIVSGQTITGGVVGSNDGTVKNCYNTGKIAGTVFNIGGVVGSNAKGTVENCYNAGPVTGTGDRIGGVAGSNHKTIKNCYNTGEVKGTQNTGGVVGMQSDGSCMNSYYLDTCGAGGEAGTKKTAGDFRFLASDLGDSWADSVAGRPVLPSNREKDLIDGDHPYEIPDADTMTAFRKFINSSRVDGGKGKVFKLTQSIDLAGGLGNEWTPIGKKYDGFCGTFDGGGHTISGLYINDSTGEYLGLFGSVGEDGVVKDLVVGGSVAGKSYVGGIAGSCEGTLTNCRNTAAVSGENDVGGVVGQIPGTSSGGKVTACSNTGTITGSYSVGGVMGDGGHASQITNCYNTGAVNGSNSVGGVVGSTSESVSHCYNTGAVTSPGNTVKSICGLIESGSMINCYYLDTTPADSEATPKTAEQFASGEVAWLLQSGQTAQKPLTWGQTVGDEAPELTNDPAKKVYKITGVVEGQADIVWYSNGEATLPADPVKAGFAFAGWATQAGAGEADLEQGAPVDKDMTVWAVFTDARAQGTGTLTMADYTCGDDSVKPVAASATNGTANVTFTYSLRGQNDYHAAKPATAGAYTVKADFAATEAYGAFSLTADFKVTHQVNGGWEHRADGDHRLCACGTELLLETRELTEVPAGLKAVPAADTVEKIRRILAQQVGAGERCVVYDVELEARVGGEWQIVAPESLPDEGVAVTIPYPEGTDAGYPFTVAHMFTTAVGGHAPGDTEILSATNEPDGIHFILKSFSPVAIGWEEPAELPDGPAAPTDPGAGDAPPTRDESRPVLWRWLLVASLLGAAATAVILITGRKKRAGAAGGRTERPEK